MLLQNRNRGNRLHGCNVARASHNRIGLHAIIGGSPVPDADSFRAVGYGLFHGEVLQMILLVRDNNIDVIVGARAMIGSFSMDGFGTISSIESLPLPDGRHVKDFDAAQAAAKKAGRAAKNVAATVTPPQAAVIAAPPIAVSVEPDTGEHSQALDSN